MRPCLIKAPTHVQIQSLEPRPSDRPEKSQKKDNERIRRIFWGRPFVTTTVNDIIDRDGDEEEREAAANEEEHEAAANEEEREAEG